MWIKFASKQKGRMNGKKGGKCSNLETTWSRRLGLGFGTLHGCILICLYALLSDLKKEELRHAFMLMEFKLG